MNENITIYFLINGPCATLQQPILVGYNQMCELRKAGYIVINSNDYRERDRDDI